MPRPMASNCPNRGLALGGAASGLAGASTTRSIVAAAPLSCELPFEYAPLPFPFPFVAIGPMKR